MEAQKRLELYEKALIDYERNKEKGDVFYIRYSRRYCYGFCWYFDNIHNVDLKDLPELYKDKTRFDLFYYSVYNKHPRIKALKKAIETVKKLIND